MLHLIVGPGQRHSQGNAASTILILRSLSCARTRTRTRTPIERFSIVGAGDCGDEGMMAAFNEVVVPAAQRFQPDIILVRLLLSSSWPFLTTHDWCTAFCFRTYSCMLVCFFGGLD